MALLTAAQVEAMIQRTGGVAVVLGATTTYGHLDSRDVAWEEGDVTVNAELLVATVATGILSGLAVGSAIAVDGDSYVINAHRRIEDGGLTEIELGGA